MGGQNTGYGIALLVLYCSLRCRQEVEVMVAQHGNGGVTQSLDEAQNVQGVRSLVDQIAGEPEPVFRGIEVDLVE